MLHAKTGIQLHERINSRGNKEQFAAQYGNETIWGTVVSANIKRRGCQRIENKVVYFVGFYN